MIALDLESLQSRRTNLCLKFAFKSEKPDKFKKWLKISSKPDPKQVKTQYTEVAAKHTGLKKPHQPSYQTAEWTLCSGVYMIYSLEVNHSDREEDYADGPCTILLSSNCISYHLENTLIIIIIIIKGPGHPVAGQGVNCLSLSPLGRYSSPGGKAGFSV